MVEFMEHTTECTSAADTNQQDKLKKEGPEKFAAFGCIMNSESKKHSGPPLNLKEQCTSGNNQCPKSLRKANNALTNHK